MRNLELLAQRVRKRSLMKSTLTLFSLVSAIGTLAALMVEFVGWSVPDVLSYTHIFGGFVVSTILLIAFQDYSTVPLLFAESAVNSMSHRISDRENAAHPLAA